MAIKLPIRAYFSSTKLKMSQVKQSQPVSILITSVKKMRENHRLRKHQSTNPHNDYTFTYTRNPLHRFQWQELINSDTASRAQAFISPIAHFRFPISPLARPQTKISRPLFPLLRARRAAALCFLHCTAHGRTLNEIAITQASRFPFRFSRRGFPRGISGINCFYSAR